MSVVSVCIAITIKINQNSAGQVRDDEHINWLSAFPLLVHNSSRNADLVEFTLLSVRITLVISSHVKWRNEKLHVT